MSQDSSDCCGEGSSDCCGGGSSDCCASLASCGVVRQDAASMILTQTQDAFCQAVTATAAVNVAAAAAVMRQLNERMQATALQAQLQAQLQATAFQPQVQAAPCHVRRHCHHHQPVVEPTCPKEPACPAVPSSLLASFVPPFPAVFPRVTTIFARRNGNDATGTGSLARPFRTFKRAIRQVPNVIAPGFAFVVDVTDLGVESFPAGYQIPPFQTTVQSYSFLDPSTLPFVVLAALNIRAFPRPFSRLPRADAVVPAADIVAISPVGPGLTSVAVSTPRASWAADGAKTAMVIGDAGDAQVNCVVYGSDPTRLLLANTPSQVAVQQLSLVEPSAVFSMPGAGGDGSGWDASAASSLAIQGIKFTIAGGGTLDQVALGISNTLQPFLELCDLDGFGTFGTALQCLMLSSVARGSVAVQASSWTPRRSLVLDAQLSLTGGYGQVFRQVVLDGCATLGPGSFATTEPAVPPGGWELLNVLIRRGTGDGMAAFGDGAYSLEQVEIDDCAGDAISARDSLSVKLRQVTGTGNAGLGVRAQDGVQVRVLDDGTLVTGAAGDMKSGIQPVRTWANFRAVAPIKNELDLVSPPVGDEASGAGTGGTSLSRIFQRP